MHTDFTRPSLIKYQTSTCLYRSCEALAYWHGQFRQEVEVLPNERSRCLIELLIRIVNGAIRGQIELLENLTD